MLEARTDVLLVKSVQKRDPVAKVKVIGAIDGDQRAWGSHAGVERTNARVEIHQQVLATGDQQDRQCG